MQILRLVSMAAACAVVLSACAQPEPEPIMPQPVFDKYGESSYSICPSDRPFASVDQNGREVCVPACPQGQSSIVGAQGQQRCVPQRCPPGQQPAASTAAAGQVRCVPIRQEDDQPNDPQRSPIRG